MMIGKIVRKPIGDFTYGIAFDTGEEAKSERPDKASYSGNMEKYLWALFDYGFAILKKAQKEVKKHESTAFRNDSWEVKAQLLLSERRLEPYGIDLVRLDDILLGLENVASGYTPTAEELRAKMEKMEEHERGMIEIVYEAEAMCKEITKIAG